MPVNLKSPTAVSVENESVPLDAVNLALLRELTADPRLSTAELGRRIGMSAPAVSARIARLEETGVIRGYRLDIDPAALGFGVTAWVRVRPEPRQLPKIVQLAEATPQVSECHRISGEDCFLMKVHVSAVGALGEVLDRFLLHGQTITNIVVATPLVNRPLPLP